MEKHIKLVAVLNIVFRCFMLLGAIALFVIASLFGYIMDFLERRGELSADEVPREILDLIPGLLIVIGILMAIVSIAAIVGSLGLMKKKEWGRITVIAVSFLNLIHVPLGTALGVYSLWVLLNDEIVRLYNPLPQNQPAKVQS